MRRLLAPLVVVAAVVAVALLARSGSETDSYRFAAEFDTAQGIVPGQLVKIAGARVGRVDDVVVTRENKARFLLRVDEEFGPFRDDASCKILPEGFIAESFIQCDVGTPGRPELERRDDLPTVELERTSASVQLQDVLDTFPLPVDERVRMIFTELGIASAGRGEDLNALLRRANPALGEARRMLQVVAAQQDALDRAITGTDEVLSALDRRSADVGRFVRRAADVTDTTAAHRKGLEEGVRRLPALLQQAQRSLASLDDVGSRLTPTADALRAAAPQIRRLNDIAAPLAREGIPALKGFRPAVASLRRAAGPAKPLVDELTRSTGRAASGITETRRLLETTREAGGLEYLQDVFYGLSTATATYDAVGHSASLNVNLDLRCILQNDAPGCSAKFDAPGKGQIPSNDPSLPSQARARARAAASDPTSLVRALPERTARDLQTVLDRLLSTR
ncbi:MAG: MlaD family protein [Solirubrobacteraceae bacterium]|nr:MlaD family protein [Solirubrobacteraceae bacterium]